MDLVKTQQRLLENISLESVASVTIPRRNFYQRHIIVTPGTQGSREVKPISFYLCMVAVLLLCTGIGSGATALWEILYKTPYVILTGTYLAIGNDILTLTAGLLSFPCFWITCTSHNSSKSLLFLPLLIILFGFCIVMLLISVSISLVFKSQIKFDPTSRPLQLLPIYFHAYLNETLMQSMKKGSVELKAWNTIQDRLKCCGSTSFNDWKPMNTTLPKSCYIKDHKDHIHMHGCINKIAYELKWTTSLSFGSGIILILISGLCIMCTTYIARKHRYN